MLLFMELYRKMKEETIYVTCYKNSEIRRIVNCTRKSKFKPVNIIKYCSRFRDKVPCRTKGSISISW